jgi:hypothetical protein
MSSSVLQKSVEVELHPVCILLIPSFTINLFELRHFKGLIYKMEEFILHIAEK